MTIMHLRLKTLLLLVSPLLLLLAAAYIQWGTLGIPQVSSPTANPRVAAEPYGFPAWLRITHYVNFLFLILLIRSGLQILMDHPRLYWNVHCTPGTEFLRLTPVEVPKDRVWTAKDDSCHLSPWIGLPGYRHTAGMARHWHFLSVLFWVGNGLVFVVMLFGTGQWQRLVPTSWRIVPDAWAVFVHYATFHLPPEPNGFYGYNALQQLAYFGVVFLLAPLAILTGPSMSPALTARFASYPKLPGNRQVGASNRLAKARAATTKTASTSASWPTFDAGAPASHPPCTDLQFKATPKIRPIAAVTVIASAPPAVTRNAARPSGAPPRRPPKAPRAARLMRESAAIAGMRQAAGATRRVAIGTVPKEAKLAAEIHAACNGRAKDAGSMPSSSRMCAPRRSCALSCSATFVASSLSTPRRT